MQHRKWFSYLSWFGAILILVDYGLLSFNILESSDVLFHAINLIASLSMIPELISKKANGPTFLQLSFSMIAIIAILRIVI